MNDSRPWWLWPNLLALDAPVVAVTWQVFLASVAGVAVPVAVAVVLALVVWAAYLFDRTLDARRGGHASDRHRLAERNPLAVAALAFAAFSSAAVIAFAFLPHAYLEAGFAVAGAAIAYFVVVHLVRAKQFLDRGVKELSVGVVFAAGTAIPLLAEASPFVGWLPGVVAFAALCWLNCTLISMWEESGSSTPPGWLALVAGGIALGAAVEAALPVAIAIGSSTAALALLHGLRRWVSVRAARVLADAVLLSPLVVLVRM